MKKLMLGLSLLVAATCTQAAQIGEVTTSGIFFKDSIEIHTFQDPTINGVSCAITYANKSFSTEDPTDSSISCFQTQKVLTGEFGTKENIFKKSKSLFFKVMRVDRFYDASTDTLVYIAYTKKTSGSNAAHAISSVPLWAATKIVTEKK